MAGADRVFEHSAGVALAGKAILTWVKKSVQGELLLPGFFASIPMASNNCCSEATLYPTNKTLSRGFL
jgi:uncharacterized protein YqfA (UPF0365 family)